MSQKSILKEVNENEQIVHILLEQDELTWQTILQELVKTEQMDPWNIDISKLANKFLELIRTLQEMDFRITGKLVLAAALLLKIKSNRLLEEDITALDSLISDAEEPINLLDDLPMGYHEEQRVKKKNPALIPRTPQPRKRKVALPDLVEALEQALEVEMRRAPAIQEAEIEIPKEVIDISKVIVEVYNQVHAHYSDSDETLTFSMLVPPDASREDKIYAFIPLLHLDHQRNIDLMQEESFGEIFIEFLKEIDQDFALEEGDLGA